MNQTPINATTNDAQLLPYQSERTYLHIRNYSGSTETMWVAFGRAATAGTNGELEIVPGSEYIWGSILWTAYGSQPSCPQDPIHVITSTGTASGCCLTSVVTAT